MRILSARQVIHWSKPSRLPEAAERVYRRWRSGRWCRQVAVVRHASGALERAHGSVLDVARSHVDAAPVSFGGGANLDLLYDVCEEQGATRVIETGVAYGWSSLAILLSISERGGRLWSTDLPYPYLDEEAEAHVGVAVPEHLRHSWTLLRGPDREQLPRAIEQAVTIDVAHYDSDKSYDGAAWAYGQLWAALRAGGVLIVDDVGDHAAFRDFAAFVDRAPTVIDDDGKFQGLLRK